MSNAATRSAARTQSAFRSVVTARTKSRSSSRTSPSVHEGSDLRARTRFLVEPPSLALHQDANSPPSGDDPVRTHRGIAASGMAFVRKSGSFRDGPRPVLPEPAIGTIGSSRSAPPRGSPARRRSRHRRLKRGPRSAKAAHAAPARRRTERANERVGGRREGSEFGLVRAPRPDRQRSEADAAAAIPPRALPHCATMCGATGSEPVARLHFRQGQVLVPSIWR